MAYINLQELETVIAANRPDLESVASNLDEAHIEFASNYLDSLDWVGSRTSSTQVNAWPRNSVPVDRFNLSLGYRDTETIPLEIKLICAELAIRYFENPGITSDSASGIAVTGVTLPDSTFDLIGDYIRSRLKAFLSSSGRLVRVGN